LPAAQVLQDVDAVLARQAEIEQDEVVVVIGDGTLDGKAVAHPVDRVAVLAQAALDAFPDHLVIFRQQKAHGGLRSLTRSSWVGCTGVTGMLHFGPGSACHRQGDAADALL